MNTKSVSWTTKNASFISFKTSFSQLLLPYWFFLRMGGGRNPLVLVDDSIVSVFGPFHKRRVAIHSTIHVILWLGYRVLFIFHPAFRPNLLFAHFWINYSGRYLRQISYTFYMHFLTVTIYDLEITLPVFIFVFHAIFKKSILRSSSGWVFFFYTEAEQLQINDLTLTSS